MMFPKDFLAKPLYSPSKREVARSAGGSKPESAPEPARGAGIECAILPDKPCDEIRDAPPGAVSSPPAPIRNRKRAKQK